MPLSLLLFYFTGSEFSARRIDHALRVCARVFQPLNRGSHNKRARTHARAYTCHTVVKFKFGNTCAFCARVFSRDDAECVQRQQKPILRKRRGKFDLWLLISTGATADALVSALTLTSPHNEIRRLRLHTSSKYHSLNSYKTYVFDATAVLSDFSRWRRWLLGF